MEHRSNASTCLLPFELDTEFSKLEKSTDLGLTFEPGQPGDYRLFSVLKHLTDKLYSGPVSLLYQCSFLRQLPSDGRRLVLENLVNADMTGLADWLAVNYKGTLTQQLNNIADLDEAAKPALVEHVKTRDSTASYARGLRISTEIMEHYSDAYQASGITLRSDILEKIIADDYASRVFFGFRNAAYLDTESWDGNDLALLKELLWITAQIEGRIIQVLDCPDGRRVIYDEYALKATSLRCGESVAYTKQGLEHLLNISLLGEKGELYEAVNAPLRTDDTFKELICAVLLIEPDKRFLRWDDKDRIWLSAGLGKRVWTLECYPLDAKALNTKDRPEPIRHQLRSELSNQDIFNQHIPVIVVDDESTDKNLADYLTVVKDLQDEFHEPLSFVPGHKKKSDIRTYAEYISRKFQNTVTNEEDVFLTRLLGETQVNKRTGEQYQVLKKGMVDTDCVEIFVRDSPMYHISGIRNYTFLLFISKGIKMMMNFDDDAPPETYCLFPRDRQTIFSKRGAAQDRVLNELIEETSAFLGKRLSDGDELSLYRLFTDNREALKHIEHKYFGYSEDGKNGLLPRAAEEIVPLSGSSPCRFDAERLNVSDEQAPFIDDKIRLTHQRYESIQLPLPDYNVAVTDFVYPEPRKEKKDNAFMVIPVNIMKAAELIGKKVSETNFMCLDGDLRGTMGVPASLTKTQELQHKTITYVPFPFILDQDTSGLAQFVRYLQMEEKTCAHLQHTDRSALVAGHVHGFVADTYVIFNRSVYDITFCTPSIGQTLRFEEPPLIKWVRAPISKNQLTVCYSPVGGGQERAIGARFYMIPFQDYNEQVGGISKPFYEKAVEYFYQRLAADESLKQADERTLHQVLGKCYISVAEGNELSKENKRDLLKQRDYRALLLSRMALQRAAKQAQLDREGQTTTQIVLRREIDDMDLILIRYADQFAFYHAKHIPNKERTNLEDDYSPTNPTKDYFYQISRNGDELTWTKVVPQMQLGEREDVFNPVITSRQWIARGKSGSYPIASAFEEKQIGYQAFEFEPGRKVILEALPENCDPIIVPAIVEENEAQFLHEIEVQLFKQIKQDGESIYIWPELVEAARDGKNKEDTNTFGN
ncbi:MAG: hypothetical protein GY847_18125 [Proteobacteria bacterium]|nr:hypothetical protein [Pseudomonadota bacterium]